LILRKIAKIVATTSHIVKLQCTKFDFGWGFVPDPQGELTVLPKSSSYILGVLLLRGGKGKTEAERGKKVKVKEERKREWKQGKRRKEKRKGRGKEARSETPIRYATESGEPFAASDRQITNQITSPNHKSLAKMN